MAAKLITIFNQKGGCAKTMTTMQLAGAYGLMGLKVFVIDMDPQNTAALWFHQATGDDPFPATVMSMAPLKETFINKIAPLVDKFDVILIDCPPAIESRVPWTALLIADLALIPVIPVMDNVWASKQAEQLVHEVRQSRAASNDTSELKAAYLWSVMRRGNVFDTCKEVLQNNATLPILDCSVAMRNAFPESQLFGSVVTAQGKSAASKEIEAVALAVAKMLDLKLPKMKGKK
jgi:chromosome partitioning protein